jgi:hypothetical protein
MTTKIKTPKVAKLAKLDGALRKDIAGDLTRVDRKIGQVAMQVGSDLAMLEDKLFTTWALLWSVIMHLKETSGLTEEMLEGLRKKVIEEWKNESIQNKIKGLPASKQVCLECGEVRDMLPTTATIEMPPCAKCGKSVFALGTKVEEPAAPIASVPAEVQP